MSELKPCPFCGGRQTYRKHDGGVWLTTTNHKRGCIMRDALSFVAFATEAEAIAAWNTRTERVDECETNNKTGDIVTHDSQAERTCRPSMNKYGFSMCCSECGTSLVKSAGVLYNYCPNCGAKVVGE